MLGNINGNRFQLDLLVIIEILNKNKTYGQQITSINSNLEEIALNNHKIIALILLQLSDK